LTGFYIAAKFAKEKERRGKEAKKGRIERIRMSMSSRAN